jgi:hypothetical protein
MRAEGGQCRALSSRGEHPFGLHGVSQRDIR